MILETIRGLTRSRRRGRVNGRRLSTFTSCKLHLFALGQDTCYGSDPCSTYGKKNLDSGLNRAARSVTVASRPLGVLCTSQIASRTCFFNSIFDFLVDFFSRKNGRSKKYFFTDPNSSHIDAPPNFGKFIVISDP